MVLPPDRLPASAGEVAVLRAAAGLERSGFLSEARLAYKNTAARWPGSLGALMGLGNTAYALKNLEGAEAAFREAIAAHPEAPAPWNNLAYVLAGQGRKGEAIAAAGRAITLAGAAAGPYRETLEEIAGPSN